MFKVLFLLCSLFSVTYSFAADVPNVFALMTDVHFTSFTDASCKPKLAVQKQIVNSVLATNPLAILLSGDTVDRGGEVGDWSVYDATMRVVPSTIPILPAFGNHETYTHTTVTNYYAYNIKKGTLNFNTRFAPLYTGNGGIFYSKDIGGVHFIALDTITPAAQTSLIKKTGTQYTWLVNDLKSPAAKAANFIVVYSHVPLKAACSVADANKTLIDNLYAGLKDLFSTYKVEVAIAGHLHCFNAQSDTGTGTMYVVAGTSGATSSTIGFLTLSTVGTTMSIVKKDPSGKVIKTYLVNSKKAQRI